MGAIGDLFGDLRVLYTAATTKPSPPDELYCFARLIEENARKWPDNLAVLCEEQDITWQALNIRANQVANLLCSHGITAGDCVSLFMQNRIEFIVQLTAIAKIGAIAGLINTNLAKRQLIHCITLTGSKKCIFGEELTDVLNEVRDELPLADGSDYLWIRDTGDKPPPNWAIDVSSATNNLPEGNLALTDKVVISSTAFYIFTSGTTGLPKAAKMSHRRMLPSATMSGKHLLRIDHNDRMYNCLPLYHGTGLIIGLMAAITVGATTVLRRRLSVSAFWEDIRKFKCTSFVYIGEFIRYLMSKEPSADDKENPIRTIVGNGLRPDIWLAFKERFGIERIGEFYGASEGNGGFANVFNKDCTVGLGTAPSKIVAYDVAKDEIIRNDSGFCVEQPTGETGLLLVEITSKSSFEGYTSEDATNKKVIDDVFVKGDRYFNSGDLMKVVDVGFAWGQKHYQFVDRVGDTFRWKSENVSTNEVGEILNQHDEIVFSDVYGVEIPGTDGRAGMAAVVLKGNKAGHDIDLASLSNHIINNLPTYARPIFLRVLKDLPTTTTHKLQKNQLRDQAFHLDRVTDELLVLKPGDECYARLDSDFYDQIMQRAVAF